MRTLPHNDDAEKALLGAILLNDEAYDIISSKVEASDFYHPGNAVIFQAITEMKDRSASAVDSITLISHLKNKGLLDKAGGIGYISTLTDTPTIISNAERYSEIVKQLSVRRSLIALAANVSEDSFNETVDIYDTLDRTGSKLLDLSQEGQTRDNEYEISTIVGSVIENISARLDGSYEDDSVPTGFTVLDKYTNGGFKPQEYIILAARPSIGKTAFGVSLIREMLRNNKKVAFFSLEMPASQITIRLLSNMSRVNTRSIINASFSEADFQRVLNAADVLYEKSLYVIDVPNIRLADLRAKSRSLKREKNIDIIIIDYIGLIDPGLPSTTPRYEVVATVSKSLKQLARELKIPVIALCQVSRDSEEREPLLSSLRDSGSIEQDADIVMFLHRKRKLTEEEKQKNVRDETGNPVLQVTKLIVAKQRNGETGEIKIGFNAATTSFENVDQNSDFIAPANPDKR